MQTLQRGLDQAQFEEAATDLPEVKVALLGSGEAGKVPRRPVHQKTLGKATRKRILERDGYCCLYCGRGASSVKLQIGHIQPVARGGGGHDSNLVACCAPCNAEKSSREVPDFVLPDLLAIFGRNRVSATAISDEVDFHREAYEERVEKERRIRFVLSEIDSGCSNGYFTKTLVIPTEVAAWQGISFGAKVIYGRLFGLRSHRALVVADLSYVADSIGCSYVDVEDGTAELSEAGFIEWFYYKNDSSFGYWKLLDHECFRYPGRVGKATQLRLTEVGVV